MKNLEGLAFFLFIFISLGIKLEKIDINAEGTTFLFKQISHSRTSFVKLSSS